MNSPLNIQKVKKYYDRFCAVKEVSFSLNEGEIFGLLGPNGAGKTSIISMITTLEQISEGQITVFGKDIQKQPCPVKKLIGVVPQELITHGFFNVEEVLGFQAGFFGLKNQEVWIDLLLKRLDLQSHRKKQASSLSGGLKKRLLIAKALIHKPKLLLLDEPTAGVDIELRKVLWEFIQELNAQGTTVLLTTHYLEEAERLCDRIGILNFGKLIKVDQTSNLVNQYSKRKIVLKFKELVPNLESPYLVDRQEKTLTFLVPKSLPFSDFLIQVNCDIQSLYDVEILEGSLEEAFQQVIGEDHE